MEYAKWIKEALMDGEQSLGWMMGTLLVHLEDQGHKDGIDAETVDMIRQGFWAYANTVFLPDAIRHQGKDYGDFVGCCG